MICFKCHKFFHSSAQYIGKQQSCPECGSPQLINDETIVCFCPKCGQKLKLDLWMEGEVFQCPTCGEAASMRRPSSSSPTIAQTPRFKTTPSWNAPVTTAAASDAESSLATLQVQVSPQMLEQAQNYAQKLIEPPPPPPPPPPETWRDKVLKYRRELVISGTIVGMVILVWIFQLIFFSCHSQAQARETAQVEQLITQGKGEELKKFAASSQRYSWARKHFQALKAEPDSKKLQLLLQSNILRPNEKYDGVMLLDLAATPDNQRLVDDLLASKIDWTLLNSQGNTVLGQALKDNNLPLFRYLLEQGVSPNSGGRYGEPLIFAALAKPEFLQLLLKHGVWINVRDWHNRLPLLQAVENKNYPATSLLLAAGADATVKNHDGDTPLLIYLSQVKTAQEATLLTEFLRHPVLINYANGNKSVLNWVLTNRQYQLLPQLIQAGLKLKSFKKIPSRKFRNQLRALQKKQLKPLENPPSTIVQAAPYIPVSAPLYPLNELIFTIIWLACGLFSLRLWANDNTSRWSSWLNLAILFTGFIPLIAYGLWRIYPFAKRLFMKALGAQNVSAKELQILNPDNVNCTAQIADEKKVVLQLARLFLNQILKNNCESALVNPDENNYHLTLKTPEGDRDFLKIPFQDGRKLIALLKDFAQMDALEEIAPQYGNFFLEAAERRSRIIVNTIGMGSWGERALLVIKQQQARLKSFNQLPLPPKILRAVTKMSTEGKGLLVVSGRPGNGRHTFIALLLEMLGETRGETVWFGVKKGRFNLPHVALLETDLVAGLTPKNLLIALPDAQVLGITAERDLPETIQLAVQQAEHKPVVLLIEKPTAREAFKLIMDSGVSRHSLTNVLHGIVNPYILHKLCPCAETAKLSLEALDAFQAWGIDCSSMKRKNGCAECMHTGVDGELAIYEFTENSPQDIQTLIATGPQPPRLVQLAAAILASRGVIDSMEAFNIRNAKGNHNA